MDYTYRGKTREITFLLRDRYFVNLDQPILIYVAANGPKALTAAGSYGDGWITAGGPGLLLVDVAIPFFRASPDSAQNAVG